MGKMDAEIAEVVSKLSSVVDTYGAEALALGGRVAQLQALHNIIWPIVMSCFAVGLMAVSWKLWVVYQKSGKDWVDRSDGWAAASVVLGAVAGIVCLVCIVGFVAGTLSPVTWATLMDYRVGLAAKILGKI